MVFTAKKSQDLKSDHLPILYELIAVLCIRLVVIAWLIYNLFISVTEQLLLRVVSTKRKIKAKQKKTKKNITGNPAFLYRYDTNQSVNSKK